ncbi:MAG: PIG-L family deacetylase [Proteobacteria bacterium]|nr:PIG-L family deacetylase [Pseudomonadota bacterium]
MTSPATAGPLAGWRLLAVVAHPDDEAWALGGTLAGCALYGGDLHVLYATRGEAGVDLRGEAAPGPELAALRSREAEAACRILGARAHFGDLPDGGLDHHDDAGRALVAHTIAALRPHVILTLGRDGGYGHLDHLAVTRWCVDAVEASDEPPRLLLAALPPGLLQPVWRRLRNAGFNAVQPGMAKDAFGVPRDEADLHLDVSLWKERKRAAVAAHDSQFRGDEPDTFLLPGLLTALEDEECFVHAGGPPLPPEAGFAFEGLSK